MKFSTLNALICSCFSSEVQQQIEIHSLTAGWSSAKLYYLSTPRQQYAVRIQNLTDLDCFLLEQASKMEITPHIYHIDQDQGIVLMDYINDAKTISLEQAQHPSSISALADTLCKAHAIPKPPHPLNRLIDKIRNHYTTLESLELLDENSKEIMQKIEHLQKTLDSQQFSQKMIHGDLHAKNMFLTHEGNVLLIDWEGALYDDPLFDIADCSCLLNFTCQHEFNFLTAYLGHHPNDQEYEHYLLCKTITMLAMYFELLDWGYALNGNQSFTEIEKPIQPWSWYTEHFLENSEIPDPESIYNWAQSALHFVESDFAI